MNPTWWWEIQKVGLRRTAKADRRAIGTLPMLFETRAVGVGAILNHPWNWAGGRSMDQSVGPADPAAGGTPLRRGKISEILLGIAQA